MLKGITPGFLHTFGTLPQPYKNIQKCTCYGYPNASIGPIYTTVLESYYTMLYRP